MATARGPRFADLGVRLVSALLLGPVAVAAIWFGAPWFTLLVGAATAILAWEWVHLCGLRVRALPGFAVAAALLLASLASGFGLWPSALALLGVGTVVAWAIARGPAIRPEQARGAVWLAAGVVYIGIAGVGIIWLRDAAESGRANVLFLVLVVWATDIGAYLAGRMIGGPKLAPAVSPNKTWAGGVGGLAVAAAVGGIAAWALAGPSGTGAAIAIALLLGVAAQAGDLLESWVKRRFMVKDTSRLIPGHGGLLDRADGLIAAAPAAAALSLAVGEGRVLWLA
ncbi:MAG: phosphatidate cytidylyltransferase [Acetobacteraceae bacterium]